MPALYFFPKKWFTQWEEISKDDCVNVVKTGNQIKGKSVKNRRKSRTPIALKMKMLVSKFGTTSDEIKYN